MNSADILIGLFLLGGGFLCAVFGYASGHRAGKSEGYARARMVSKRISSLYENSK